MSSKTCYILDSAFRIYCNKLNLDLVQVDSYTRPDAIDSHALKEYSSIKRRGIEEYLGIRRAASPSLASPFACFVCLDDKRLQVWDTAMEVRRRHHDENGKLS